jgi:hypothetical protein
MAITLAAASSAPAAAEEYLKPIGGHEGSQFHALCPPDRNLHGFELRVADDVDAIRAVCVPAFGPTTIGTPAASGWYGGPGGGFRSLLCPPGTPVVIGLDVAAEGWDTLVVNQIHLYCGVATTAVQVAARHPSAVFDGPSYKQWPLAPLGNGETKEGRQVSYGPQRCSPGQVAVGLHGRSGIWVDSIGLVCAPVRLSKDPRPVVTSVGRTHTPPSGSPKPICEQASDARARNSPAAAKLEEMCRASRVASTVGRLPIAPASGPPPAVCDQAAAARDRNSPAAAALAQKCQALGGQLPPPAGSPDLDQLAGRGAELAAGDPALGDLRDAQPEGPVRRGFDIGIGASAGQSAWGPGKQRILDSLPAAEQEGYKVAVSFELDRNREAARAALGAAIAGSDPELEAARRGEADPRYALGFDIATAIFGDTAQGAQGNTATGPGSLGIRDGLSAPARRGFDAAVRLHLARRY